MAQLGELPLTDIAAVRLNAQVDPGVLGQVRRIGKRLGALRALVRLGLAHVDLCVELQICLATEYLQQGTKKTYRQTNKQEQTTRNWPIDDLGERHYTSCDARRIRH